MKKTTIYLSSCLILFLIALSSCLDDDNGECSVEFKFIYDYNILESDAIAKQVDKVTLLLYRNNILAYTFTKDYTPNSPFTMSLDGIEVGSYEAVALAQSTELKESVNNFVYPLIQVGKTTPNDLKFTLPSKKMSSELNRFLLGAVSEIEVIPGKNYIIPLKKVTNKVRVVLLDKNQEEIDPLKYKFDIYESVGNGIVNYKYQVIESGLTQYQPYFTKKIETDKIDNGGINEFPWAVAAEFSLSKLIAEHPTNLIIKSEGEEIINVNVLSLIKLGMLVEYDDKWPFQEYLDRKDAFVLSFFIDGKTWLSAKIIVNGWVISNNHIEV
ncbi:FimB/Mfa2 family fimbrial subunit [Bacteroides sp.]|uniref:FimB/Mfa2 family fimbrial subunit n=1 Tax=Bacteroides sp. TaxID=29523 RepID=UPI002585E639|nr:FimB/Mfa2 family fimbrial subunit [Bacteroides sp.]